MKTPTEKACATPPRVARAYQELLAGLRQAPEDVLTTLFELGHDEMILVKDIEIVSLCEHHLLPFRGTVHVGYIPAANGRITGLSKLARLVEVYAHVGPRHPQARGQDDDLRRTRPTAQVRDARRSDEPHPGSLTTAPVTSERARHELGLPHLDSP